MKAYFAGSYFAEETSLNVKAQFSERNGFYLSLPVDTTSRDELQEHFISVIQKKRQLHFTSIELVSWHKTARI
jgi:hypothetical protein